LRHKTDEPRIAQPTATAIPGQSEADGGAVEEVGEKTQHDEAKTQFWIGFFKAKLAPCRLFPPF
jgi:hypothetical protein